MTYNCDRLIHQVREETAEADYIYVGGCLKRGHINVRYYCAEHWERMQKLLDDQGWDTLFCTQCSQEYHEKVREDDRIVEHV